MSKWTANELFAMIDGLRVPFKVGGKHFEANVSEMALVSIREAIDYGTRRKAQDRVGGRDVTDEAKVSMTELWLPTWYDGSWVDAKRGRAASVPTDVAIKRKVALAALGKSDRKTLAEMDGDERAALLDDLYAANEAALRDEFDKAMAEITRPKPVIALGKIALGSKSK